MELASILIWPPLFRGKSAKSANRKQRKERKESKERKERRKKDKHIAATHKRKPLCSCFSIFFFFLFVQGFELFFFKASLVLATAVHPGSMANALFALIFGMPCAQRDALQHILQDVLVDTHNAACDATDGEI